MPPADPEDDLPFDPRAATAERVAHLRQTLAFDAHEEVFGASSPLELMKICAWRLMANGQWREGGLMADRIAPYLHERVPTTTIVHSSAVPTDEDAPALPPPLLDRPTVRVAPGGLSILHNLDPAELYAADPEPEERVPEHLPPLEPHPQEPAPAPISKNRKTRRRSDTCQTS